MIKGKLIKTKGKFILVSDEGIKEGDYFWNPATKEVLFASKEMLSWNSDTTQQHKGWLKIIVGTLELPSIDLSLSLKNCQAIERGYDLDELADELHHGPPMAIDWQLEKRGFKAGFQKALEILGDKKYSEEDLDKAFDLGKYVEREDCTGNYLAYKHSLQKTEWDVSFNLDEKDENGCLILKRID